MTSKTDPAIDFGNDDYNPNQYSYTTAKQDGIYMGRLLMRDEVLRLITATNLLDPDTLNLIIEHLTTLDRRPRREKR
jgi:hypothetical protein